MERGCNSGVQCIVPELDPPQPCIAYSVELCSGGSQHRCKCTVPCKGLAARDADRKVKRSARNSSSGRNRSDPKIRMAAKATPSVFALNLDMCDAWSKTSGNLCVVSGKALCWTTEAAGYFVSDRCSFYVFQFASLKALGAFSLGSPNPVA